MSRSPREPSPDSCGCCQSGPEEPKRYNRPGLSAISYRVGTHPIFRRRMLDRLHRQSLPDGPHQGARPLSALTTRTADDPGIALIDAWSTVLDVLTFYQERIANEGYLRTATERRSVLELARTIGYELRPGVAAGTFLAFTVESVPGMPPGAFIPRGTQVKSLPAKGKLPQTFETMTDFEARVEWNQLLPRLTRPQDVVIAPAGTGEGEDRLYLIDTQGFLPEDTPTLPVDDLYRLNPQTVIEEGVTAVRAVPVHHLCFQGMGLNLEVGQILLLVGQKSDGSLKVLPRMIQEVEELPQQEITRINFEVLPPQPPAFVFPTLQFQVVPFVQVAFGGIQVQQSVLQQNWRERDFQAFLLINHWDEMRLLEHLSRPPQPVTTAAQQGVFAFREKMGFFGHNAPLYSSLPKKDNLQGDPYPHNWDNPDWEIWKDPLLVNPKNPTETFYYTAADVYLERVVSEVLPGSWVLFKPESGDVAIYRVEAVREVSRTGFGISGKVTGLTLARPEATATLEDNCTDKPSRFKVRTSTAYVTSEALELARLPIETPVPAGAGHLMLDGLVPGLQPGQPVIIEGELQDTPGVVEQEAAFIKDVVHARGYTTLFFEKGLQHSYVRSTLTVRANVVEATHGETVTEVLGSGDNSRPNQRFELRKPPLTYVSAATPTGTRSSLTLRVDGIEWEEAPSLFGLAPEDSRYIVRIDDDGKTFLTAGDGHSGARLPTGTENVIATYRSGIGPDGEVEAHSLTLLQTRPHGVREVTNPLPASGAAPPESRDDARQNAPLTVLTLDRIVSLRDFQDFARAFAGIGKAQARLLWNGETRLVHVTVGSATGKEIDRGSALYRNLVAAIDRVRDPFQPVRVDSFQLLYFHLDVGIKPDPRFREEEVFAAVEAALQEEFRFEKRQFGQPVTAAEIAAIVQGVDGVIAGDLNRLYRVTDPAGPAQSVPPAVLTADAAHFEDGEFHPAQLLLLNPAGIILRKMEDA
ncbi:MAG: putative baseplate assembly protein [Calditrichaeota bacterium]|nr:MAG: putative baseplate assembly protein [Calditrichota bacterium]